MPKPQLNPRHFPPGSQADTLLFWPGDSPKFLHASTEIFFEDSEILDVEISPDHYVSLIPGSDQARFGKTADGRTVLQQHGWRGCTAACAEMIKADLGFEISLENLDDSNLGDEKHLLLDVGLSLVVTTQQSSTTDHYDPLAILDLCLRQHGSGILAMEGHVVVLDRICLAQKCATLRDPYHGWSIVVELDALRRRLAYRVDFVQVDLSGTDFTNPSALRGLDTVG